MHVSVLTCCPAGCFCAASGFGRIGRNFLRCLETRGKDTLLEVIAINDSGGVKQVGGLDHS
jgi:glyceraldehyde-3-phosphate dehydrogenase/erythrose-4-phosphate dehydrogenase